MRTNLKQLRKAAGWSNANDFAESIGMPAKTYRNYEQGVRTMGLDVASEICNALGCSLNDLPSAEYYAVELPAAEEEQNDLAHDERDLVSCYRRMVDADKESFLDMAHALAFAGDAKKKDARGAQERPEKVVK